MLKSLIILSLILFISCSNSNSKQEKYMFIKGINFYQKGKKKEALNEYKKVYDINSKNIVVIKEIAIISYELGDINSAIKYYEEAYKLDSSDKDIVKNLANLYYSKGDYKSAEKYLQEISEIEDNDILKLKGYLSYKNKKYLEAYGFLKKYDLTEYDENFIKILKETMLKANKKDELYIIMNQLYSKFSNEKEYINLYANTLVEEYQEYEKAENIIMKYISEYSSDDRLYMTITKINLKLNRVEEANNSFELISENFKVNQEYIDIKKELKTN